MASLQESLIATFARLVTAFQTLKTSQDTMKKTWINIVTMSSTTPTYMGVSTIPVAGKVYKYTYQGVEYYRLVPDTYSIAADVFYLNYTETTCSSPQIVRAQ